MKGSKGSSMKFSLIKNLPDSPYEPESFDPEYSKVPDSPYEPASFDVKSPGSPYELECFNTTVADSPFDPKVPNSPYETKSFNPKVPDSPYEPAYFVSKHPKDPDSSYKVDLNRRLLHPKFNPDAFATAESCSGSTGVSALPPALANLLMSISGRRQASAISLPEDLNPKQNLIGIMGQGEDQMVKNRMEGHPEEFKYIKQILEPFHHPHPPLGEPLNFHGEQMNCRSEHMNYQGNCLPKSGLLGVSPPGFESLGPPMLGGPFLQGLQIPELMLENMANFPGLRPFHNGLMQRRGNMMMMMMRGCGRGLQRRGNMMMMRGCGRGLQRRGNMMMRGCGRGRGGPKHGKRGPKRGRGKRMR